MNTSPASEPFFIESDGEMAGLIKSFNWSETSLGGMEEWPPHLVYTLNLLLTSAFPMVLYWGPDHIYFYNDAFRTAMGNEGKHPSALGAPAAKIWSEIWDTIEPLLNIVMEGHGTSLYEDLHLPIYRNGKIDEAYWTFCYNPVKNEKGNVSGVLGIGYETTIKVKGAKDKELLQEQLQLALEAGDLGTLDLNPLTMRFSCNHRTKEIFSLSGTENISLDEIFTGILPEETDYVKKVIREALLFGTGGRFDISFTIHDTSTSDNKIIRAQGRTHFYEDRTAKRLVATLQDITTEKIADNSQKRLQQLVENSGDFMATATMGGDMLYINSAGRNLLGLPADYDITRLKTKAFYSDEQYQTIMDQVMPVLEKNRRWEGFVKIRHFQTGEDIPCHANYLIICDPLTGAVISRGVTFRDLRQELEKGKELEDSEKRFRNLVQEAPVATAIYIGREMKIQWANDAMIRLWGKDKSVIGKTVREALPELEGQPFHNQLDEAFMTGRMYQGIEDPGHLVVDGQLKTFYFNFSYKPLRESDGKIYGILNMAIDVTESVKVKRMLEESEKNFRSLIMQAPIGITLLKGYDHIVDLANDEYLRLVGRERDGFIGKPIWELIPEAKEQGFDVILKKVMETGEPFFGSELPVLLIRNGRPETIYINFVYEPLYNEHHQVHSILVVAIDVTAQVEARKLVEIAEERARIAIGSASLGTYDLNIKTMEVHASPRLYELFDIEPTIQHRDFMVNLHPDDQAIRRNAHDVALMTGRLEYECRIQRRDGTQNWLHIFGQYYFDENGQPEKVIGIVKDVTKEKAGEQELERRVKERTEALTKLNEELQQFTYVSSHDLKEPLRKVQMYTGMIRDQLPDNPKIVSYSDKVLASTGRMTTLINDLLNYSTLSNKDAAFEKVDLSQVIEKIQDDMEVMIRESHATISISNLPIIKGIPFQLNQLFYNLLNNALKFSAESTAPLIHVRCSLLSADERLRLPGLTEMSYYKIEIIDNGIGFDPEYAERIFGVFQRLHLKHQYSGNGIGLAICKKIVQNHKGMIYAQSATGKGSTFVVILPEAN